MTSQNGTKRALLVARVSTNKQAEFGYSVPTQLEGMRAYSRAHSLASAGELVDECSGTIPMYDRPGGRQVYEAIRAGSIDALVFYTIDRASRDEDVIDFLLLKRELRNTGIELHFADTGLSQNDSISTAFEYLKVSEAGRELKKIVERTSRGRRAKAAEGKWVGAGQVPYGYTRRGKRGAARLAILEREARIVRQIFDWFTGAGAQPRLSLQQIAARLTAAGVPTPSRGSRGRGGFRDTVRCILANPIYLGEVGYLDQVAHFPKLAVVDEHTWAVAQECRKRSRALGASGERRPYLLSGHLRCNCRAALIGITRMTRKGGPQYQYYRCNSQNSHRHMSTCRAGSVRLPEADEKVWGWVAGLLSSEDNIRAGLQRLAERREIDLAPRRARLATLDELLAEARAKIARWVGDFGNEADAEIRETVQTRIRETARVRDDLLAERTLLAAELDQGALLPEDEQRIVELAAELRAGIAAADFETQRYFLDRLDVQGMLREDEAGRWLECTCAVPGWQASVVLDKADPGVSQTSGSCGRGRRASRQGT
jgi:site-specific DNA recombinase